MFARNFLPFYPHKIAYLGMVVLGAAFFLSVGFLSFLSSEPLDCQTEGELKEREESSSALIFSLGLESKPTSILPPKISQELSFGFESCRPDESSLPVSVFVKIKKTGQSKRVILPGRFDLEFFEGEKLRFSEQAALHRPSKAGSPSICGKESDSPSFWVELDSPDLKKIEGKVFIETPLFEIVEGESFIALPQEISLQSPQEFAEGSPFRFLSEGKWWGADRFREKYENGALFQRVEVGPFFKGQPIDLQEGDWLIWLDNQWVKGTLLQGAQRPIARVKSVQGKSLIFEGWEGNRYVYFALNSNSVPPLKMKGEDLFTSIRVRSAKQISCMLEKQWLVLKSGDWVFKSDGRWKILKKKEERELYCSGNISGDLFVFEKIESKLGQKWIQGQFFTADKSQVFFIDLAVPAHGIHKGKNEGDIRKGGPSR